MLLLGCKQIDTAADIEVDTEQPAVAEMRKTVGTVVDTGVGTDSVGVAEPVEAVEAAELGMCWSTAADTEVGIVQLAAAVGKTAGSYPGTVAYSSVDPVAAVVE